jgi:hypothetical protein
MNNKRVDFKIGDYVKVKKGVLDPDNDEYRIEDWQGIIIGESISSDDEPIFGIKWDSVTLKSMPEDFIIESIQEDLKFQEMYLGISELVHAKPRNDEQDEDKVLAELNKKYNHIQPNIGNSGNEELRKQEHRIAEILKGD